MLTISLDEWGTFEKSGQCLIGGVAFHGDRPDIEEKELARFLKDACDSVGAKYPRDLHISNNHDNTYADVERTKKEVKKRLGEYITSRKNGRYYFFAMLSTGNGVSQYSDNMGNFLSDSEASNKYIHMLNKLLRNVLINNPIVSDKKIKLYPATRSYPKNGRGENGNAKTDSEHKLIGTESNYYDNYWSVATPNTYVAMINEIATSLADDTIFENCPSQIKYNESDEGYEGAAFQYLSDIICTFMSDKFKKSGPSPNGVPFQDRFLSMLEGFTHHKNNMLWYYCDDDFTYSKAAAKARNLDYYGSLSFMYSLYSRRNENITAHYDKFWTSRLFDKFHIEPRAFITALKNVHFYLYTSKYDLIKAEYILEKLEKLSEMCKDSEYYDEITFWINYCHTIISNHNGMFNATKKYYKECSVKTKYIPLQQYFELRNIYSVSLLDSLKYSEAVKFTEQTLEYEKMANEMVGEMMGAPDSATIHYGQTLSQLAQCYAFNKDYKNAKEYFLKALDIMKDDKRNYTITLSYYLHFLIASGDIDTYKAAAAEYFDTDDIKNQFFSITKLEDTNSRFAFYVWTKAWYVLFPDQVKKTDAVIILNTILKYVEKYKVQINDYSHPWELIFKYCAFMAEHFKEKKLSTEFIAHLTAFGEKYNKKTDNIVHMICMTALNDINNQTPDHNANELTYMYC